MDYNAWRTGCKLISVSVMLLVRLLSYTEWIAAVHMCSRVDSKRFWRRACAISL